MLEQKKLEESIISLLGIQALPDEQKLALLDKMSNLTQKRVSLRVLEKLDKEEQEVFMASIDKGDEKKVKDILERYDIDVITLAQEEIVKLKDEMKGVVDGLGV